MKLFNQVQVRKPVKNKFNLSHERKLSFRMGELIPVNCMEIVPGDSFRVSSEILMRTAPLLAPIMHRVNVRLEHFFVPNRLIYSDWENFITGGVDGDLAPVAPYAKMSDLQASGNVVPGELCDFLGLPTLTSAPTVDCNVSVLPLRAYQLIWNEYYRDPTLQPPIDFVKTGGLVDNTGAGELGKLTSKRYRCWEKDYFTSALPWAQRGADVSLPIDGLTAVNTVNYKAQSNIHPSTGGNLASDVYLGGLNGTDDLILSSETNTPPTSGVAGRVENIDSIDTDISGTSTTINELRRSIRLQEWLEKNARAGYRYIEQIFSHFGVKSSDARLQRPEFLGGSLNPVSISEVLSTVQQVDQNGDNIGTPQGDLTGRGISVSSNNGFKRSFEEHGFVVSLLSVVPRSAYQQGVPRMFTRDDKFDYYWPDIAQLGEQDVKYKEIYNTGAGGTTPAATFGYESRCSEYESHPSMVHGDFRTNLAFWHMGRIFTAQPELNENFVSTEDVTDRVFAVQDSLYDNLWCQIYHKIDALRPMPYFGTPTI